MTARCLAACQSKPQESPFRNRPTSFLLHAGITVRIAEEAQTSSLLRAVHQLGGEPSSLHSHIVPPTWQVTAKAQHLKPFSSPCCKHKLVLRKIFKKIIFSTAVFNGKCHLNSAGCTHYFACLAAVALGQVLKIRANLCPAQQCAITP